MKIKLRHDGKTTELESYSVQASNNSVLITTRSGVVAEPDKPKEPPRPNPKFRRADEIDWKKQPGTTTVDVWDGAYSKFTTTKKRNYAGEIAIVPSAGADHVTWTVWFSKTPGGLPLGQSYKYNNVFYDSSLVSGQEPTLRWTQDPSETRPGYAVLERNTTYYLNYTSEGCNGPSCALQRSMYSRKVK